MTTEITIQCCRGREGYKGQCLKNRCPNYSAAKEKVLANWPRASTGFGNLYGEPSHSDYLAKVAEDVQNEAKKVE